MVDTATVPSLPTSSSSPTSRSASTPPSSDTPILDSKQDQNDPTTMAAMPPSAESSDSEMEILPLPTNATTPIVKVKRKSQVVVSAPEAKKQKVTPSTKTKAAPKPTSAKGKGKDDATTPTAAPASLVELKNRKLVFKQKAFDLLATLSSLKAKTEFSEFIIELLNDADAKLTEWPKEHWALVARMIHGSDKSLQALVRSVKDQVVKMTELALGGEDDSQDTSSKPSVSLADRFPTASLKGLIESLASRTNYGLDASDLPTGFPEGVSEMPLALQLWRWEVHDSSLLPPELESKLSRHRSERVEAKSAAIDLVTQLNEADFIALFAKEVKAGAKKGLDVAPVASGSGEGKGKAKVEKEEKPKKAKVVKPEIDEAEAEKLAQIKAEKDAEKAARKLAREQANAERDEKKAKKLAIENEKKAKEEKKIAAITKQSALLTGFFKKKSASPAPTSTAFAAASAGTPGGSKESDFNRVFKPFHVKTDVRVAPINRFLKAKSGKAPEVIINSLETITLQESLASFVEGVPPRRIPLYNPHPSPALAVRDAVHAINDANLTGSDVAAYYRLLENRAKVPVKFLKFKEDVRPGYIGEILAERFVRTVWQLADWRLISAGTWTKTSRVVGPRTPFGKDTALLRYDYDSEDEWEEDEAAEDAEDVNSNGERSDEDDSDAGLSDDWLCEDDEVEFEPGHEGDDVVPMDVDGEGDCFIVESATEVARRKVADREKKSKSAKDGAKKRKLAGPLLPLVKGPYWEETIGQTVYPQFKSLRIQFLNDATFGLDPFSFVSSPPVIPSSAPTNPSTTSTTSTAEPSFVPGITGGVSKPTPVPPKPAKPIAENLIPRLLDLIHGSNLKRGPLVNDCHEKMRDVKATKASIAAAMKDLNIQQIKPDGKTDLRVIDNSCVLTHQLPFQTYLAIYFVLVDVGLMSQYIYYARQHPIPDIPPLAHSRRALHRSHSRAGRNQSRKRRSRMNTSGSRNAGNEDPMERSWMSGSSIAHSPASTRPHTQPQSRRTSFRDPTALPPSTSSTAPPSPTASTHTESTERGRSRSRPARTNFFGSVLETISGSASGSPSGLQNHDIITSWPVAHGSRSRSRPPPPPAARRTSSMVFLSVGVFFGFGRWALGGQETTETGLERAWSTGVSNNPLSFNVVPERSWSGAPLQHPALLTFKPTVDPFNKLINRRALPVDVPPSTLVQDNPSNRTDGPPSDSDGKDEDDDDDYPYPKRDLERFIGRASAWICTTLYLTSRLPQIWQNFRRRSVEGLAMMLFVMAFVGNSLYVLSIITNPLVSTPGYLLESTPYLLGSGGTLCFDITIVLQSVLYSEKRRARQDRDRRRISKHNLDAGEAAALLDGETEEEEDGDTTGDEGTARRKSRSVSKSRRLRSTSSRRPPSTQRTNSTELHPRNEHDFDEFDVDGRQLPALREWEIDSSRGSSMRSLSRGRSRTTSAEPDIGVIPEEGESSMTIRGS
ncbi:chromatin assembly factor 1 subunit A, partial [Phenoliferia sp. Uapishka_3]